MSNFTAPTTSRVVIHDSHKEPVVGVAIQLLEVLGHDVMLAKSADQALAAAVSEKADLLVLSLTDHAEQSAALERLAMLAPAQRPNQVAILSDDENESSAPPLQRKLPGTKVHVLVKPIHAHGLLKVIKRVAGVGSLS